MYINLIEKTIKINIEKILFPKVARCIGKYVSLVGVISARPDKPVSRIGLFFYCKAIEGCR